MMMTENFKKDVNNALAEIQESKGKHVEALKEENSRIIGKDNQTGEEIENKIQDLKAEIK